MKGIREKKKKLLETLTREGIYEAVEQIMAEDGVEGLTMSRLAERAGIAKGTIYLYFKDKDDLIRSAMDHTLDPLKEEVMRILESDEDPEVILQKYARFVVQFFKKNRSRFSVLHYRLTQQEKLSLRFNPRQKEHYELSVQKIAAVIEKGIKKGRFKEMDSLTLAHILVTSVITIVKQYMCQKEKTAPNIDANADLTIEVFMNGIKNH